MDTNEMILTGITLVVGMWIILQMRKEEKLEVKETKKASFYDLPRANAEIELDKKIEVKKNGKAEKEN